MGPGALQSYLKGEKLAATKMRTPLVELPLGATGAAGGFLSTGRAALADALAAVLTLSKHPAPTNTHTNSQHSLACRGPHLRHH